MIEAKVLSSKGEGARTGSPQVGNRYWIEGDCWWCWDRGTQRSRNMPCLCSVTWHWATSCSCMHAQVCCPKTWLWWGWWRSLLVHCVAYVYLPFGFPMNLFCLIWISIQILCSPRFCHSVWVRTAAFQLLKCSIKLLWRFPHAVVSTIDPVDGAPVAREMAWATMGDTTGLVFPTKKRWRDVGANFLGGSSANAVFACVR